MNSESLSERTFSEKSFSEKEWRALTSASMTGASESARALAMLLRVDSAPGPLSVHRATGPVDLGVLLEGDSEEGIGISFALSGAVGGSLLVFLDEEAAFKVASQLMRKPITGPDERALAALSEMGNILASAFLNGISRYLKRACLPSVPGIAHAPARVLLLAVPVRAGDTGIVCAERVGDVTLRLAFLPEHDTARRIVDAVEAAP